MVDVILCLVGLLMGYVIFGPRRGLLCLPSGVQRHRGWCVVGLAMGIVVLTAIPFLGMCRATAQYVYAPCPPDGYPPVNVSPAMFLCFSPPAHIAFFDVLKMTSVGIGCVVALHFIVWLLPRITLCSRILWNNVLSGWTVLSAGLVVLLFAFMFFVEPLICFFVLSPLRDDAKGIAEIDDLVRCNDAIRAGDMQRPMGNHDPEVLRPREKLLEIYGRCGACNKPGYEHISVDALSRLSPSDRESLVRILTAWDRKNALRILDKVK